MTARDSPSATCALISLSTTTGKNSKKQKTQTHSLATLQCVPGAVPASLPAFIGLKQCPWNAQGRKTGEIGIQREHADSLLAVCSLVFPPALDQRELCEAVWRLEALEDHVLLLSGS
jgi:hypothetical protein